MSEELQTTPEKATVTPDQLLARLEALEGANAKLESTNARLLDESKTYKGKYQSLSEEIKTKEKNTLEDEQKFKELYEVVQKEKSDLSHQLMETRKSNIKKELSFQVAAAAKDAYDVNDIISSLPKEVLELDHDTASVKGVSEAVNFVCENKPWLFQKNNKSGFHSGQPSDEPPKTKTYESMSGEEKNALFSEALKSLV